MLLQDGQTILISRTDAIGDVVLTLPVAAYFKQKLPQTKVLFLGRRYTRPIIEHCPFVDKFLDWDAWKDLPFADQQELLLRESVDVFIHIYPRREIARLADAAHISEIIGTSHRFYHWDTCTRLPHFSRKHSSLHESQLNFKLLKPLGIREIPSLEEIQSLSKLSAPCLAAEYRALLDPKRYNLILHPRSSGSAKEWGLKNFAQLIRILPREKFKIFLCGTTAESESIRTELLEPYADVVTDLIGKFDLETYMAFIREADGLLAASTGPLHLAATYGRDALGIYPPQKPIHPERWKPIGIRAKVFSLKKNCRKCRKTNHCTCMESITPQEIASFLQCRHAEIYSNL